MLLVFKTAYLSHVTDYIAYLRNKQLIIKFLTIAND
jgi:hypothetical protein